MTETQPRERDFLEKASLVLLALQFAVFAKMWIDLGFDRATDNYPVLMMSTALFAGAQRKLAARPPNPGAGRWLFASRAAALAMLTLGTLAIAYYRLVPDAAPAPTSLAGGLFALMWAMIALKGAGIGKLKPGSAVGLCVSWTRQSRLAWDKGHRTLGRVLFWGGLIGLATCLAVDPLVTLAMWAATVTLAVTAALFESWRTWRIDPDRRGGHAA
jgi:uncharacterized membrane protein